MGNGIIVQWGFKTVGSGGTATLTFPVAFTSTNYAVAAADNGSARVSAGIYNYATSSCTLQLASSGQAAHWIAIGY